MTGRAAVAAARPMVGLSTYMLSARATWKVSCQTPTTPGDRRALLLSIAATREVLEVIDDPTTSVLDALGAAHHALSPLAGDLPLPVMAD